MSRACAAPSGEVPCHHPHPFTKQALCQGGWPYNPPAGSVELELPARFCARREPPECCGQKRGAISSARPWRGGLWCRGPGRCERQQEALEHGQAEPVRLIAQPPRSSFPLGVHIGARKRVQHARDEGGARQRLGGWRAEEGLWQRARRRVVRLAGQVGVGQNAVGEEVGVRVHCERESNWAMGRCGGAWRLTRGRRSRCTGQGHTLHAAY